MQRKKNIPSKRSYYKHACWDAYAFLMATEISGEEHKDTSFIVKQ